MSIQKKSCVTSRVRVVYTTFLYDPLKIYAVVIKIHTLHGNFVLKCNFNVAKIVAAVLKIQALRHFSTTGGSQRDQCYLRLRRPTPISLFMKTPGTCSRMHAAVSNIASFKGLGLNRETNNICVHLSSGNWTAP